MEVDFDQALKSLGNMYDDEVRAREQLEEIQGILKNCKNEIRTYKLPVVSDVYFVQLGEAQDAVMEVIHELEQKPIVIKTLNTRVDTARDLVLKLYNTTNEMIHNAELAERCIVYLNRFRSTYDGVNSSLDDAEEKFNKGDYREALECSIKATSFIDENIYGKLKGVYEK